MATGKPSLLQHIRSYWNPSPRMERQGLDSPAIGSATQQASLEPAAPIRAMLGEWATFVSDRLNRSSWVEEWRQGILLRTETPPDGFRYNYGLYDAQLQRDPAVIAGMEQRTGLVTSYPAGFRLREDQKSDPHAKATKSFLEDEYDRLGLEEVRYTCHRSGDHAGFALFAFVWGPHEPGPIVSLPGEATTARDEGYPEIQRIVHRHPRHFTFDGLGNPLFHMLGHPYGVPLKPWEYLLYRPSMLHGNPFGEPLGEKLVWLCRLSGDNLSFWALFNQGYALPRFIGEVMNGTIDIGGNLSPAELQATCDKFGEMVVGMDPLLFAPQGFTIRELEIDKTKTEQCFKVMQQVLDEEKLRVILGESSTVTNATNYGQGGSRAIGDLQAQWATRALLRRRVSSIEFAFNTQVFDQIIRARYMPSAQRFVRWEVKGINNQDSLMRQQEFLALAQLEGAQFVTQQLYDEFKFEIPEGTPAVLKARVARTQKLFPPNPTGGQGASQALKEMGAGGVGADTPDAPDHIPAAVQTANSTRGSNANTRNYETARSPEGKPAATRSNGVAH